MTDTFPRDSSHHIYLNIIIKSGPVVVGAFDRADEAIFELIGSGFMVVWDRSEFGPGSWSWYF